MLGELDEALASGTRAVAISRALGDLDLRILATSLLEQVHHYRGEYERAVELATDNLAALPADRAHEYFGNTAPASVYIRTWLSVSLAQLGRFAQAARYEDEMLRLAEPTHHAYTISLAHWGVATVHLLEGDWEGDWATARSVIDHWVAVTRTGNVVLHRSSALAVSALVLAQLGDESEAVKPAPGSRAGSRASGAGGARRSSWLVLSRAQPRLPTARPARRGAAPGRPRRRVLSVSPRVCGACAPPARRHRRPSRPPRGRERGSLLPPGPGARRATRHAPLVAHCHLGLGELYRQTGRHEEAQESLATATALYRALGMR